MAYNITGTRFVSVFTCSDSYKSSTQESVNDSSGVIFSVFKYLNIYIPKPTMDIVDPLKGPSPASMTCSDNFEFNPNAVNIPRLKII